MNLRLLALAAAAFAGSAALASACGAPDLFVPPPARNDSGASGLSPCAAESVAIRANTGVGGDAAVLIDCKGMVVAYDPPTFGGSASEGLCDASVGYLVCDQGCFSEFSCEIPDGDRLVELDGAPVDGGEDEEGGEAETDATADATVDAQPADAATSASPDDAGPGALPDVSLDAADAGPVDAPAG